MDLTSALAHAGVRASASANPTNPAGFMEFRPALDDEFAR
jgi:hypothetical protein